MLNRQVIIVCLSACALCACNKNGNQDQESPRAVTNTNATVHAPNAAPRPPGAKPAQEISAADNASMIKRFRDEVPLAPTEAHLVGGTTTARTAPGGETVTVFTSGGGVTELARDGDWYLVVFPDANDTKKTLAGWIYKDGIVGTAAQFTGQRSRYACKPGEVHVLADGVCATACAHDPDCKAVGGVCDGCGQVAIGENGIGRAQYCVAPPPQQ